ncbi:VAMP-like protein [Musa troglodytarum]|uniref:VAMP-like protein n=1 Tax=Musa troglodytarum TaxID=320322 RepID=A0A9E7GDP6_9LILI|nr:VAMP-like protein [Musa troglodytarum]
MDSSSSSPGNIVFFSVSKEKDLVYSYNGGGQEIQALALSWSDKAKFHHAWHSHTVDNMTFGFLMQDGYTFFAIDDDGNAGNSEILLFLERLRDAFREVAKDDKVGDELSWVIRVRAGGDTHEEKRPEDVAGVSSRALKVDVLQGPAGGVISLSRSLSCRLMAQQRARRLWWRQVKIVAAVDALLCLTMFAVWLVVCEGFQCVS